MTIRLGTDHYWNLELTSTYDHDDYDYRIIRNLKYVTYIPLPANSHDHDTSYTIHIMSINVYQQCRSTKHMYHNSTFINIQKVMRNKEYICTASYRKSLSNYVIYR